jgi:sugar porter (SP) family MFS transporter
LIGTVSSIYNVGCASGGVCAFFFGSALGRKKTIISGTLVSMVGTVVQFSSVEIVQLLVGRIVTGVGVGILTSTVGLWQAETTPAEVRGRYMSLELMMGGVGVITASYTNYGMRSDPTRAGFIVPLALQLAWLGIIGILTPMLPESPSWLFKNDRQEEALKVLIRLQGDNATRDHPMVQLHMLELAEASNLAAHGDGFFSGIFVNGPTQNFRRICFGTGIMIMHQLNGINSVTYYVPTLVMTFIHASHGTALWVGGLTGVIVVVFSTVPVLFVDKLGRLPFLLGGSIGQTVCLAIVAGLFATAPAEGSSAFGIATLAMIYLYYAINMMSWYPISWVYPAELMPLHVREKGMGFAVIIYWLFQFMMVEITPIALKNIDYQFYIILCIFNAAIAAVLYLFYPETARKSLEEIDFEFAKKDVKMDLKDSQRDKDDFTIVELEDATKRRVVTTEGV